MHVMTERYQVELSQEQASKILELLQTGSDLEVVSRGPLAVDLQLPNAPSPHAVNLEASYSDGLLRLTFHMAGDEIERRCSWLRDRALGLDVNLVLESAAASGA